MVRSGAKSFSETYHLTISNLLPNEFFFPYNEFLIHREIYKLYMGNTGAEKNLPSETYHLKPGN